VTPSAFLLGLWDRFIVWDLENDKKLFEIKVDSTVNSIKKVGESSNNFILRDCDAVYLLRNLDINNKSFTLTHLFKI